MKRWGIKEKLRQQRLIAKAIRRKSKKKHRYTGGLKGGVQYQIIQAPEIFSLYNPEQRKLLLRFIERLRRVVALDQKPTLIDFTPTRKMFADGTLLFVAELRRLIKLTRNSVKIRCTPPRNKKATQVLKQVQVLTLLKYRRHIDLTDRDVVNWRFAAGHEVVGERYDDILGHYDGTLTPCIQTGFYHGLTEAMTNCCHHAYIMEREDGLEIKNEESEWWMFSQERDGELSVVFCDLGVGIPNTLPLQRPSLWEKIKALGGKSDAKIIHAAIEDSKTRTGLHHRGKGMKQLLEVIQKSQKGNLVVYSNRGCYAVHDESERVFDYTDSVLGTLISWKVPIESNPEIC